MACEVFAELTRRRKLSRRSSKAFWKASALAKRSFAMSRNSRPLSVTVMPFFAREKMMIRYSSSISFKILLRYG